MCWKRMTMNIVLLCLPGIDFDSYIYIYIYFLVLLIQLFHLLCFNTFESSYLLNQSWKEPTAIVGNHIVNESSSDYELFVAHVFGNNTPTIAGLGDAWSDVFSFVSVQQHFVSVCNLWLYHQWLNLSVRFFYLNWFVNTVSPGWNAKCPGLLGSQSPSPCPWSLGWWLWTMYVSNANSTQPTTSQCVCSTIHLNDDL